MNFNFTGIEAAQETQGSTFVAVKPGYQKLTILEVKDAVAASGSMGFEVKFSSDKGGEFSQKFFIADAQGNLNGAAPSFQYLVEKFTGQPLAGDVNSVALSARLVGKSLDVTVGGRKATTYKEGKRYDNIYAWLPFAGYAGEVEPRYSGSFDPQDASNPTTGTSDMGTDNDLPF